MLRNVLELNPKISEHDLAAFERRFKIKLPASYKEFLLETNGGRPEPAAFPIVGLENNPEGVVQAFFGLKADISTEDLENNLAELEQLIPKGILPIGCTDGDEYLVIDLRKPGAPVLFWDRVPFWGNNVWNESYLYPVASDFETLLRELHDFVVPDA